MISSFFESFALHLFPSIYDHHSHIFLAKSILIDISNKKGILVITYSPTVKTVRLGKFSLLISKPCEKH